MSESTSSDDASAASKSSEDERRGIALPDEGAAAMAAVLHLLRLISAELVLFRGLDVQRFEKAMREKISEFTSPIANQQAKDVGLAFARSLVDKILVQVRAQAELKNSLAGKTASDSVQPAAPQSPLCIDIFERAGGGSGGIEDVLLGDEGFSWATPLILSSLSQPALQSPFSRSRSSA